LGHDHDLVERDATPVARVGAVRASDRPVEHGRWLAGIEVEAEAREALDRALVLLLAAVAEPPREALGDDRLECRADEKWLDVHLDESGHRRWRAVRVER